MADYHLGRLKNQRYVHTRYIAELHYADDMVLFGNSLEGTQELTNAFVAGMEVNTGKTKFLGLNVPHTP